ncbi:MAG TPA: DUF4013 domain-containing protein [Bacteroidota bacterium]|nr:DUF4013 domain-containing protein [Bacteroidota bacterium]
MRDIGKAFSLPFKDPSWVSKFLLAALFLLLCLVGLGIPIIVGYLIQVTQRVIRREERPLPEWSDIGVKFVLGFKYCVVYVIYLVPVVLLVIPVVALGVATSSTDAPELVGVLSIVYMFGFTLLVIPYSLLLAAIMPIVAYRFALTEKIADGVDVAAVFRDFRRNWQNTAVVALITIGIESLAFVGIAFFLVGIFFTVFYVYLVSAAMRGLLYLELPPEGSTA